MSEQPVKEPTMHRFMAFFSLLALAACSSPTKAPTPKAAPPKSAAKAELNVYIWTNYHSEKAVERFEKENNAKVVIDTYDNNEVIEQKLQAKTAPYDIVVPTDYMVTALARQELLLPLDEKRLPDLVNIDPQLDWSKAQGLKRYSVPYLWGTSGFAYRTDKLKGIVDSWAPLFDPTWKGRVVMLDDMREDFAVALKSLGYSANTTDENQLLAARDKLVKQKPLVLAYDSSDFAGKIQAGDGWVVHGYSGELARVARASEGKIVYVVPKEGTLMGIDNLAIPKAARNVDLAYKFIEFMLKPDIAAQTTDATGYPTANKAARPMIKPEIANDPAVYPPPEVLAKCELLQDLGEKTARLDELWTEVKAH
jgi:spermidine/putrescine-binding protein